GRGSSSCRNWSDARSSSRSADRGRAAKSTTWSHARSAGGADGRPARELGERPRRAAACRPEGGPRCAHAGGRADEDPRALAPILGAVSRAPREPSRPAGRPARDQAGRSDRPAERPEGAGGLARAPARRREALAPRPPPAPAGPEPALALPRRRTVVARRLDECTGLTRARRGATVPPESIQTMRTALHGTGRGRGAGRWRGRPGGGPPDGRRRA